MVVQKLILNIFSVSLLVLLGQKAEFFDGPDLIGADQSAINRSTSRVRIELKRQC